MNEIRQHTNASEQYNGSYQSGYLSHQHQWSPAKKYLVIGGATLAVITGALFLLAFKIALVVMGVLLVPLVLFGLYTFLHRKFDN